MNVVEWAKDHPLPAAAIGGVTLALIAAAIGSRKGGNKSSEYVVPNVLTPGAIIGGGSFGGGGGTVSSPSQPPPTLTPSTPPPPTTPPPITQQTSQYAMRNGALFDLNIVGSGFTNRSTDEAYRGQTWAPSTTEATITAPAGGTLVSGQWRGDTLVAGTYVLPDGSRVRVTS